MDAGLSTAISRGSVASNDSTGFASFRTRSPKDKFKASVHGVHSLLLMQGSNHTQSWQNPKPSASDVDALVQRLLVTLKSARAFRAASLNVFNEYSVNVAQAGEAPEKELPLVRLSDVLAHWRIPEEHLPLFWTLIRRELKRGHSSVLPQCISLDLFQAVLIKFLRRIRDRYCVGVSSHQFLRQRTTDLTDDYVQGESCGRGGFGECHWVVHKVTKQTRVAKTISKQGTCIPNEEIVCELQALKCLDHPHVIRMFEWFESESSFTVVMEAAYGGNLRQMLTKAWRHGGQGISEAMVQSLVRQSIGALAYIHSQHVIHRDVKPSNMLLLQRDVFPPHVLLADFGVAEFFDGECRNSVDTRGTFPYMGPEVFIGEASPRSDIWSIGVVIYELLCGERPFKGDNPLAIFAAVSLADAIVDLEPLLAVGVSNVACAFISRLLTKEEGSRPSAQEVLNEDWMNESDEKQPELLERCSWSMKNFGRKSTFGKAILNCVARQLDASSLHNLNLVFKSLDTDCNGTLSSQELNEGLMRIGLRKESVQRLADSLDLDNNASVEYSEFIAGCLDAQMEILDGALYHAFKVFDVSNDGQITLEDLRAMLSGDGESASLLPDGKTVHDVMKEVDISGDGAISYEEFKAYLRKQSHDWSASRPSDHCEITSSSDTVTCAEPWSRNSNPTQTPRSQTLYEITTPVFAQAETSRTQATFETFEANSPTTVDSEVVDMLRQLFVEFGRDEKQLPKYIELFEREWLRTLDDLRQLELEDWARLQLPLKLELALRKQLSQGCTAIPNHSTNQNTLEGRKKNPSSVKARDALAFGLELRGEMRASGVQWPSALNHVVETLRKESDMHVV